MAWIASTYREHFLHDLNEMGCVTGKPLAKAELQGEWKRRAVVLQFGLREFVRHSDDVRSAGLDGSLEGKYIVVQGLGNVGYRASKFLSDEDGAQIVAVIERDGAIVN